MKRFLNIVFALTWLSCDSVLTPDNRDHGNQDPNNLLTQSNAGGLTIAFVAFDQVQVGHRLGTWVQSREFTSLTVGLPDSGGKTKWFNCDSSFTLPSGLSSMKIAFALNLDESTPQTRILARYWRPDSTFFDWDTTILQYKYPYASSEIFVTSSIMLGPNRFQDIAFLGNRFFFHPTGGEGFYEYDFSTKTTRALFDYGSGDCLAADSIFVFCDTDHRTVVRFNLNSRSKDLVIDQFPRYTITGIETYGGILYVKEGNWLRTYTYAGAKLDSIYSPRYEFHLAIYNNKLYAGSPYDIWQTELSTYASLPLLASPASNLEGIKVHNLRLYYCDADKNIVASIPLNDLTIK